MYSQNIFTKAVKFECSFLIPQPHSSLFPDDNGEDSIEEPKSPSLLCSQAVLGDTANYSVSIHNQDTSTSEGKAGE